jgi:hypothetical protein
LDIIQHNCYKPDIFQKFSGIFRINFIKEKRVVMCGSRQGDCLKCDISCVES